MGFTLHYCLYGALFIICCIVRIDFTEGATDDRPITDEQCLGEDYFRCDDTQCIEARKKCNGISECRNGWDESIQQCGCPPGQFQCNNTHCVDITRRCDIAEDCANGEDEDDCEPYICLPTYMKCANHFCIPDHQWCDFKDDCGDNSDEATCEYRPCHDSEWQCDNKQCVPGSHICDGYQHCFDGTDEIRCDEHVLCDNGLYVSVRHKCDGWVDCVDSMTDELNCGPCDPSTEYACANTRCINLANRCDGHCDCGALCDDETNCSPLPCLGGDMFICEYPTRCLQPKYVCDGRNDCQNDMLGLDERYCKAPKSEECAGMLCPEGKCIPERAVCDGILHCVAGADEKNCGGPQESCEVQDGLYHCTYGRQCVSAAQVCDGHFHCSDLSDELNCLNYSCPVGTKKCKSGQCLPHARWCDFRHDCLGGDDEDDCDHPLTCPDDNFRCNNGQCIPLAETCVGGVNSGGGQIGCVDSSHLLDCRMQECDRELFKCVNSYCINQSAVCNDEIDCKATYNDEQNENCTYSCPYYNAICQCHEDLMDCTGLGLTDLPEILPIEGLTKFRLGNNRLRISSSTFENISGLTTLDLSNNGIEFLNDSPFAHLDWLQTLNLENNELSHISNQTFNGLMNLKQIYLRGNRIEDIQSEAFLGLLSLKALDLSHQKLENIPNRAFVGLVGIYSLNLSHNDISSIEDGAFYGMPKLMLLDISHNNLIVIGNNVFHGMNIKSLFTDEFRFCCLATLVEECWPKPDEFSSCEDLMSNVVLRMSIWVLGCISLLGNSVVIAWRIKDSRDSKVHSFLIANLAIGDLLMGVYLLMIAGVDYKFRGVYILYDAMWRHSVWCKLAGFLSTYSSEISVLTLLVITMDRFVSIIFPFRLKRLGMREARIVMASLWLLVCGMAALPLIDVPYFENFYGRSGVCLALHITPEKPRGWEYSVSIFLALNFVTLTVICCSYCWMFQVARKTRQAVHSPQMRTDTAMARRMTLIVLTDFFCWMPITILGVASLSGLQIPQQVYAWIAVFILPLNAAINPILYTMSTAPFLGLARRRAFKFRQSFMSSWAVADTRNTTLHDDRCSPSTERFRYFSTNVRGCESLPLSVMHKSAKTNGQMKRDSRTMAPESTVEVTYGYDSDQ